jgi:2'-5' RNA ligase
VARCSERHPEFRWVRPENLHLTLRFLGAVEAARLDDIEARLRGLPAHGFELALMGTGSFGSGRWKRVLWIGVTGAEPAAALAARIEDACVASGLEPEARPFRAHITLARARDRRGAPEPALAEPPATRPWRPPNYVLFQSKLGPGGPQYLALTRFPLLSG